MNLLAKLVAALALCLALVGFNAPSHAGDTDPLFINLTSDDGHRVNMALTFGGHQMKRGHALSIFLNDRAVAVASKANAEKFAAQQKALTDLLGAGATILVCPMCMKHYGVSEADLLPGLKVGSAELTGAALFKDNGKTMTW